MDRGGSAIAFTLWESVVLIIVMNFGIRELVIGLRTPESGIAIELGRAVDTVSVCEKCIEI